MPNVPKTQNKTVRIDTPKWAVFGAATASQGTDRSKAINQFVDWYIGLEGAELPARPADSAKDPGRTVLIDAEIWAEIPAGGEDPYAERASLVNQILRWFLRRPGAGPSDQQ